MQMAVCGTAYYGDDQFMHHSSAGLSRTLHAIMTCNGKLHNSYTHTRTLIQGNLQNTPHPALLFC